MYSLVASTSRIQWGGWCGFHQFTASWTVTRSMGAREWRWIMLGTMCAYTFWQWVVLICNGTTIRSPTLASLCVRITMGCSQQNLSGNQAMFFLSFSCAFFLRSLAFTALLRSEKVAFKMGKRLTITGIVWSVTNAFRIHTFRKRLKLEAFIRAFWLTATRQRRTSSGVKAIVQATVGIRTNRQQCAHWIRAFGQRWAVRRFSFDRRLLVLMWHIRYGGRSLRMIATRSFSARRSLLVDRILIDARWRRFENVLIFFSFWCVFWCHLFGSWSDYFTCWMSKFSIVSRSFVVPMFSVSNRLKIIWYVNITTCCYI